MALPTFDPLEHDVGLAAGSGTVYGFMRINGGPEAGIAGVQRQDATPVVTRAVQGEGRFDTLEIDSFIALGDFAGGQGQRYLKAADRFYVGRGESRPGNYFGPSYKLLQEADGGTAFPMWDLVITSSGEGGGSADVATFGITLGDVGKDDRVERLGETTTVDLPGTDGGNLRDRAAVTGDGNALFVWEASTGARSVQRHVPPTSGSGAGTLTDVSPPNHTPDIVKRHAKWIFTLGRDTIESSVTEVQEVSVSVADSNRISGRWNASGTQPGSTLVAVLVAGATSGSDVGQVFFPEGNDDWEYLGGFGDSTTARHEIFLVPDATPRRPDEHERWRFSPATAAVWDLRLYMIEVSGLDLKNPIDVLVTSRVTASSGTASVALTGPASGVLARAKGWAISVASFRDSATDNYSSATPGASWTEQLDNALADSTPDSGIHISTRILAATTSISEQKTVTLSGATAGTLTGDFLLLVLKGNNHSADYERFGLRYTEDEGVDWESVRVIAASAIGAPLAGVSMGGFLWFTTARGIYRLAVDEEEFEDHQQKLIVSIQTIETFEFPYDTASSVGTQLASWDGAVFYNVGATLRRAVAGTQPEQIWPPSGWSGPVAKIQGIASGEGGVYFGAGGLLYCYNGSGYHVLAKETVSGQFDVLHWSRGRLYCKGDPAYYMNFQYPSSRQDIVTTAPTNYEVGYMITSIIDCDKVDAWKLTRLLKLHGRFTAGTNATESGTIALHYLSDPATEDPGRVGDGATSLTWVSIGSMSVTDGATKEFTLATPHEFKRTYLRVTITPGTVGFPILEALVLDGVTLLPVRKRFPLALAIGTNVVSKRSNTQLYADDAAVKEAVDWLIARRAGANSPRWMRLQLVDEINGATGYEEYTVIPEQMTDNMEMEAGDDALGWVANFVVREFG